MAYALVEDLEDRFGPLSDADAARAEVLLEDAKIKIDSELKGREAPEDALRMVSCYMVNRAMLNGGMGITQQTETAGPYSQSITYANPSGKIYLTKDERAALGIRRSVGFMHPIWGGADD